MRLSDDNTLNTQTQKEAPLHSLLLPDFLRHITLNIRKLAHSYMKVVFQTLQSRRQVIGLLVNMFRVVIQQQLKQLLESYLQRKTFVFHSCNLATGIDFMMTLP